MMKELRNLSGMNPRPGRDGYLIVRYWHPDSRKGSEVVGFVDTLEEAQEHCSAPEASHKEGPTSEWYFEGYADGNSRTYDRTLW